MIDAMPRPRPPHLLKERTRHGAFAWYVRIGHGPRIRIRAPYGSPEFTAEYTAAVQGSPLTTPKRGPANGTLAWLIARYMESAAWSGLSVATRGQRGAIFQHIIKSAGGEPYCDIDRKTIAAGRDRRASTPAAAKHFVQTMRGLFSWAIECDLAATDPTAGVKVKRPKTEGFAIWTEDDIQAYEAHWPLGTRQRVALAVLLYTGLRRGDAVMLGRQHVSNNVATLRTEKTGETVSIPILKPLADAIAAGPCGDLAFIAGKRGRPMTKESFGTVFRSWCDAAGVKKSAHGLRKAGATRAAEAGATEMELMALFGWSEPRTAAIYTRTANRKQLARQASDKVEKHIA